MTENLPPDELQNSHGRTEKLRKLSDLDGVAQTVPNRPQWLKTDLQQTLAGLSAPEIHSETLKSIR